jgi:hypothetical protein
MKLRRLLTWKVIHSILCFILNLDVQSGDVSSLLDTWRPSSRFHVQTKIQSSIGNTENGLKNLNQFFYFLWTTLYEVLISWFPKFFFYWFSGRIRTFYRRKTGFYEKKKFVTLPSAVNSWLSKWEFCPVFFEFFLYFWPREQSPSSSCHMNFWLLFHIHVKNLPILMFLGLIWCKILCWAQKSILYGVWNATESHESPKTEFVSHEIFISRVTYPSIRNFKLNSKKVYVMGFEMQPQIMRAQKSEEI